MPISNFDSVKALEANEIKETSSSGEIDDSFDIFHEPIRCYIDPDFTNPEKEYDILAPVTLIEEQVDEDVLQQMDPYVRAFYKTPLLKKDQEFRLFRQLHFFRYKALCAQNEWRYRNDHGNVCNPNSAADIEYFLSRSTETRNVIAQSNLRMVVNVAKKYWNPMDQDFFDIVNENTVPLLQCVSRFDYRMGYRFSTFAMGSLEKNVKRFVGIKLKRTNAISYENAAENSIGKNKRAEEAPTVDRMIVAHHAQVRHYLKQLLDNLDQRLQKIIIDRFGLNYELTYGLEHPLEPLTQAECGAKYGGVSKERISKLEQKALRKLEEIARCTNYEIPEYIVP